MTPMGWQLSAAQWDVLTEVLRLEGYPAPIQVRSHGRTDVERGHIRAEVDEELRRLGVVRAGRVEADLEAALRLLHQPASWVDSAWLPDAAAEQPVRVVAARGGAMGVCALQHPDRPGATVLDIIPSAGLAAAVVGRLPPHPLGRSAAVTIALAPSPERPGGVLVSASPARTSVERERAAVSAILDQPHLRAGQIAANVRDSAGRMHRSQVLRWCDNPDGRYQINLTSHPGNGFLTVTPGDPHRLATTLQHLLDSLH
ncbi:MAG: ESX secretion-associated protein EspG [Pseudonocardiales bacterium]|nr:ESX secretion-associated protein EspG [Pseudonocardiales bacterium]